MEHSVRLVTRDYRESICECLRELCEQEELPLQIVELRQGKSWLIQCIFQEKSVEYTKDETYGHLLKKVHCYYLANALAKTVLQHWEKKHIQKMLRKQSGLTKEERLRLTGKILTYLEQGEGMGDAAVYRVNRQTVLVSQILKDLDQNSIFDLEGFLSFRAQDYKRQVDKVVGYVFDEYVLEKEYVEFIALLKYFVDSQKPRLERLHVGMSSQGGFHLYNDAGVNVTTQYLDDYQLDKGRELGYEDLLVSALIAVAPRSITLHTCDAEYRDTLQTIRHVFGDRVTDCPGCILCEP